MSQTVLPNTINYAEQLPSISPATQNFTQVCAPVNGATFGPNQQIFVDIPSRGFIDPQSIYIRYRMLVSAGAAQTVTIFGCPVYTPFTWVETFINSQQNDSVADYNVVAHAWSNLFLGINEKYGAQFGFGYNDTAAPLTTTTTTLDKLDGRIVSATVGAGAAVSLSGPLVCTKLSACEKFIPAFATGGIRLIFTLDNNTNILSTTTNNPTFNITNFELVYDMIDFGPEV